MGLFGKSVEDMAAAGDIPGLIKALGSASTDKQAAAIDALARIGVPALDPLTAVVTGEWHPLGQPAAVRACVMMGDVGIAALTGLCIDGAVRGSAKITIVERLSEVADTAAGSSSTAHRGLVLMSVDKRDYSSNSMIRRRLVKMRRADSDKLTVDGQRLMAGAEIEAVDLKQSPVGVEAFVLASMWLRVTMDACGEFWSKCRSDIDIRAEARRSAASRPPSADEARSQACTVTLSGASSNRPILRLWQTAGSRPARSIS